MYAIVRVPRFGLSIGEAHYYGFWWALHIGHWLVFFGKYREPDQ